MVEQAVLGSLATATPVTLLALSLSSWRSYEENMSIWSKLISSAEMAVGTGSALLLCLVSRVISSRKWWLYLLGARYPLVGQLDQIHRLDDWFCNVE